MLRRHGPKEDGNTKPTGWRLQTVLADYIEKAAKDSGQPKTRVVEDALRMHRDLTKALAPHKPRFQRYALDAGLDWDTAENEIYARLIVAGLEQHEKRVK